MTEVQLKALSNEELIAMVETLHNVTPVAPKYGMQGYGLGDGNSTVYFISDGRITTQYSTSLQDAINILRVHNGEEQEDTGAIGWTPYKK